MLGQGYSLSMLHRTCEKLHGGVGWLNDMGVLGWFKGMEALHLLRDWGKLQIRDSDYRNHWVFTLRCSSKGITPVSIRLKTTVWTEKARKIIRKAERDLLQARVKSINSLLDNKAKERNRCRSELVFIVSTTPMLECQELIEKVRECWYLKVRAR